MTITRRWQSGLETGSLLELDYVTGSTYIDSTYKKTGTYSFKLGHYDPQYGRVNVSATRQVRVGCNFLMDTIMAGGVASINALDGTKLVDVELNASGQMIIDIAGTDVAWLNNAYSNNIWYHIGIDVKIDSSAGWVYVYKDGQDVLHYTGNTGNSDVGQVRIGHVMHNYQWNYSYYDDIFVDDTTGESTTAVVPIKIFRYITPVTGSPTYAQWDGSDGNSTDNYALVDEVPPSETDYVCTNVVNELDSYQMSTFTLDTSETIKSVIPLAYVKRYGTTEQIALGTRYSSTDVIGSDQSPSSTYSYRWERQTTKPGGGSWDQTALDGVEVVIKARGSF